MNLRSDSAFISSGTKIYYTVLNEEAKQRKLLLSVSFFLTSISIFVAYSSPATGYELSIYRATPVGFWVFLLSSFAILSLLLLRDPRDYVALSGIVLDTFVIVLLPLIRGWYFIGKEDSLKNWGYLVDLARDTPFLFSYLPDPGMELLAFGVHLVTGESMRYSLFLVPFPFVLLFVVSVGLILKRAGTSPISYTIGILSGLLLLPINWQSIYILPHASSQATMYLGYVVYVSYLYYTMNPKRMAIVLTIVSPFLLILHPQIMLSLVLVLGFALCLWLVIISSPAEKVHRKTLFLLLIFGIPFGLWGANHFLFANRITQFLIMLTEGFGAESLDRGSSVLSQKGLSIQKIFVRLFLVSLVYCLFAGAYGLRVIQQSASLLLSNRKNGVDSIRLIDMIVSSVPLLFLIFFLNFLGENKPAYYLRYFAVIMVFVTLAGGLFLTWVLEREFSLGKISSRTVLVLLLVFLIISLPIVYPSPYIGKSSHHVTEKQVQGFNTMFRYAHEDAYFLDLYSHAWRYYIAQYGYGRLKQSSGRYLRSIQNVTKSESKRSEIDIHFDNRTISEKYEDSRYLSVTDADRQVEVELFDGARTSRQDFRYLNNSSEIHQIYSNGGVTWYYL
jgi:hypothetical protein